MSNVDIALSIAVIILSGIAVFFVSRPRPESRYDKFKAIDEKKGKE